MATKLDNSDKTSGQTQDLQAISSCVFCNEMAQNDS